ncbi:hypothetical protein [Schlesneria sp. T3-172]|uniref:hypothetical protein n=1 Tax=Schlesneria sphaerica TaxID=3373610 RepID=UPI0037CC0E84
MNEDTSGMIILVTFLTSIVLNFVFYFGALRRLFIPPTPSPGYVMIAVFGGVPGIPAVYIWGWIRHRPARLGALMLGWTAAIGILVGLTTVLNFAEGKFSDGLILPICTVVLFVNGYLAVRILIPFLRGDGRMRAVMRDLSTSNVWKLAELQEEAFPILRLLLENDYLPYRLAAIDCLSLIGPSAVPLLEEICTQGDTEEAAAARSALLVTAK